MNDRHLNWHRDWHSRWPLQSTLLFVFSTLSLFSGTAKAESKVHFFEQIKIGYQLSAGADRLCQDGQYLYFNTKADCHAVNAANEHDKSRGEYQRFNCEETLEITPLREVEEIFIPEFPNKSILRFFSVQTTYSKKTYEKIRSSRAPDRFRHISTTVRPLEKCVERPQLPQTNIFSAREANPIQKYLISSLISENILVLNMPHGTLNSFNPRSSQSIGKPTEKSIEEEIKNELGDFAPIHFAPNNFNLKAAPADPVNVRSPYCNPLLDEDKISTLLGGESSGGGYRTLATDTLQRLSTGVEIRSVLSSGGVAALLSRPFRPNVRIFEVNCLPTLTNLSSVK